MTSQLRAIVLTGPAIIRDHGYSPEGYRQFVLTPRLGTETLTVYCSGDAPSAVLQQLSLGWVRARHATAALRSARRRRRS